MIPDANEDQGPLPTTTNANCSPSRFRWRRTRIALVCATLAALPPATAAADDIPLTFFNGRWSGAGTDRAKVSHPFQNTQCTSEGEASTTQLRVHTVCRGDEGLTKQTDFSVVLNKNAISGELRLQSNAFPYRFSGSVSGGRTADAAVFSVRTFLLGTVATVSLQVIDGDSYRLSVADGDALLTRTRFTRR